ncbi:MAG TPA: MSMEG_0567/Sll0786 family nitrogen starvation N-acetyltransferase, partial [Polyangiaceae bacterium]|nr:MSMEG_0567/Sll0786 family nitrogen starvation N-acetyltransferase [Polyangiaceae bacterium]
MVNPWGSRIRQSLCAEIVAEVASEAWQLEGYRALRRAIFSDEQGLFEGSDFDEHDQHALPIVAQSQIAGMADGVVGVVRIYRSEPATWYGGRLGVHRDYRRFGAVGAALIACAVSTAHALGCQRFLATVQVANVRYFERHHFRSLREVTVQGRPHCLMQADLVVYPPRALGARFVQA